MISLELQLVFWQIVRILQVNSKNIIVILDWMYIVSYIIKNVFPYPGWSLIIRGSRSAYPIFLCSIPFYYTRKLEVNFLNHFLTFPLKHPMTQFVLCIVLWAKYFLKIFHSCCINWLTVFQIWFWGYCQK